MKRHVSIGLIALLVSVSHLGIHPAVAGNDDFSVPYEAPDYKNTQLPSITSCDPKNPASTYTTSGTSAAADVVKTIANAGMAVKDGLDPKTDDAEGIDGKATIDTECGEPSEIADDNVKDRACKLVTDDYITGKKEEVETATKIMACQRGKLTAMGGEVSCLQTQIGEADKAIDAIINNTGGLASMLKTGQDTFQDRVTQLDTVTKRIKGTGENDIGLEKASKMLQDLGTALPAQVDAANAQTTAIREDQANFVTLQKQVETAAIMECMNTPNTADPKPYMCVPKGSGSKQYPVGIVSPIAMYQCLYGQSLNKIVGGKPYVSSKEAGLYNDAKTLLTLKPDSEIRASSKVPPVSDIAALRATYKTYDINTPEDLLASLKSKIGNLNVPGKNLSAALDLDFKRCKGVAEARNSKDAKAGSTGWIRNLQTVMDKDIAKQQSTNASAFRDLRNKYALALKAATGSSKLPDTAGCEKGTPETQASCFDALNSMVDTLYTGKVRTSDKALTGPALALTSGGNPVSTFLGSVEAKVDKSRTIPVKCSGVDDCLTQYTSIQNGLTSFKESYPTSLNNTLQQTATNIATGMDPKTGRPVPGAANLKAVVDGVTNVKKKLMDALGKMGVDDGLSLDPKAATPPGIDEKTGLYQLAGLRGLVQQSITPGLPDANGKGFGDTIKAINARKKEVKEEQKKLAQLVTDLESRKATCDTEAKKLAREQATLLCDAGKAIMESSCKENNNVAAAAQNIQNVLSQFTTEVGKTKALETLKSSGLGQGDGKDVAKDGNELNCGRAKTEYYGCVKGLTDNKDKDATAIGSKKKATTAKDGKIAN